jgi:hypothetical protein
MYKKMAWYDEFNGIFFITISSGIFGMLTFCIRMLYKSKCREVDICCFHITRDVDIEANLDEIVGNNVQDEIPIARN